MTVDNIDNSNQLDNKTLYVSTHLDKKQFKKLFKPKGCYFIESNDLRLTDLANIYQEFIFLQSLEKIFYRAIKNKGIESVWCRVEEHHAELLVKKHNVWFKDVKIVLS